MDETHIRRKKRAEKVIAYSDKIEEKIVKYSAIAIVLLLVIVVAVMLSPFYGTVEEVVKAKKTPEPKFNINSYSYTVSSEKPADALSGLAKMAETSDKIGSELTIYNDNLALVKEIRELDLKKGLNLVKYKDIASQIDATSVLFHDLSSPDTFVVEQNYEYDLVSTNKLLEKYLEKEITVDIKQGQETKTITGKLLSYKDGVLLETQDGVVTLNNVEKISFPYLVEGLLTKPTLVWKLYTEEEGKRNTQTIYLTSGISWKANYIAETNEDDTKMNFKGWVTTTNNSGTSYPNTKLKLVAGDIHRVREEPQYKYARMYEEALPSMAPEQFEEEALFEYHMYTLGRETNINNNEVKQISLLSAEEVPIKKEFVFDDSESDKVQVKILFANKEEQGLGMPLPKGVVRVYKKDKQGQLQFLGEDNIDHTPKDEERRLTIGNAFDVVAEKTELSSESITQYIQRYSYEVKLRNHKEEEIEVNVVDHFWRFWTITKSSHPVSKQTASQAEFLVKVPANGETTLTYTVEYNYKYA